MDFSRVSIFSLCACFLLVSCRDAVEVKNIQKEVPQSRAEQTLSYASVVKKVAPAVVNIYAFHKAKVAMPQSPLMADPFFRQFFDHLQDNNREQNSLGSGVIMSKDGLVLTNYHVIEGADEVHVVLSNKREYLAKVVSVDKRTDLALLKIEDRGYFPYLTASPQENLEVGDVVLAIGNPFGVGQTVTTGIISALARSQEGISDFRTFIQTDAAINPGNSGGPLVTSDGRLVGINTAIYSRSGGSMGIGFAIPISLAIPVIESVNNGGHIMRPWVGLQVDTLPVKVAYSLGFDYPYGVVVQKVYPGGPADKAGIKVGDVIIAFDNHIIENEADLDYQVGIASVGKKVEFTVARKGEEKKFPVTLIAPMTAKDATSLSIEGANPLHGSKIRNLSPALAIDMGLSPMEQGVVVSEVSQDGAAARLGIKPGDILESINQKSIKTKEDAIGELNKLSHSWMLVLRRGDKVLAFQAGD